MSYKNPNTMGGSFAYYDVERRTRKSIFFKPMDWNPIEKELKTFGSLKRWFGSGTTRLKGKSKVHSIHVLEAIAHNLKRSPGLVATIAK